MTSKKNYIGISRDHSASMGHLTRAAMADYNDNIDAIRTEAGKHSQDTIVSVVRCGDFSGSNRYSPGRPVHGGYHGVARETINSSVNAIRPLTTYTAPGSATPLFDSVMDLIEIMEKAPDKDDPNVSFLVMAITDGENNAGINRGPDLARKIAELNRTDRWTFVFRVPRGAKRALTTLGIPEHNILEWEQTEQGVVHAMGQTRAAFTSFYGERAKGATKSTRFYADMADVSTKDVKKTLVDISPEVKIFKVDKNNDGSQIRDFLEKKARRKYKTGTGFYQLAKTEEVQEYKKFCIRDKKTGAVYSGVNARNLLSLPDTGTIKLAPGSFGNYEVFVQSTSVNRKLSLDTNVLYWANAA